MDIQVGNIPLIFRLNIHTMPVSQEVNGLKVIHESSGVDDRNASIQSSDLVETTCSDKFG